jgi:hypothetical protein
MLLLDAKKRINIGGVMSCFGLSSNINNIKTIINIRDCSCRTASIELLKQCKMKKRWLIHCLDIINTITFSFNPQPNILVPIVVSLVSKFWCPEYARDIRTIVTFKVPISIMELVKLELLYLERLEYTVYRPLLCDLVHCGVPQQLLIDVYKSTANNGLIVQDISAKMNSEWDYVEPEEID